VTHPGVGLLTALAFVLIIGKADRFLREQRLRLPTGCHPASRASREQTLWPDLRH
jgi:hypothetical protein